MRGIFSNSKFCQMKRINDPGHNADCGNGNEKDTHLGNICSLIGYRGQDSNVRKRVR